MISRRVATGVVLLAVVLAFDWTVSRLSAQTKGAAESSAAARVDPSWKVPRTAWGHPDLEGVWASDDMRGVPMSRPAEFGTRASLSDEEFAARAKQRGNAREVQEGAVGTFRNEEGTRVVRLHVTRHRTTGRPSAADDARRACQKGDPGSGLFWCRSVRQARGLHAVRQVYHPWTGRIIPARGVRQRRSNSPDAR